jgi:DNA-binding transcriptional regulator YhcF (GntR family)
MKEWTFLTNHGLVLLYISQNPQCTTRQMASAICVTERTVHRVLDDLEGDGYITRRRTGRGNIYQINPDHGLKHDLTKNMTIRDLLGVLVHKRRPGYQRTLPEG